MSRSPGQDRWLRFWNSLVYRSLAPLYNALDVLTLGAWWRLVRRALDHVPSDQRVLELGFGPGKLQAELAKRSTLCVGLDLAMGMCRFTQRRLDRAGLVPRLVCGDARRLPFDATAFDAVVSTFTVSGIPDGQSVLAEQARVVSGDGRVILVDIAQPSDGNWLGRTLARLWERVGDYLYDYRQLMRAVGLEVVEFEEFGPGRHIRALVGERQLPAAILGANEVRPNRLYGPIGHEEVRMIQLDDVKQLLERSSDRTLTLYLMVDPAAQENQAPTPTWRIWLKDALKSIETDRNVNAVWPAIRARVEAFFAGYRPSSKGLALFIGPDFQQVYELPVPLENQAAFGRPPVAPLLWAIDEYERYLIVTVDREQARFYTAQLGEVGFQGEMQLALDTTDWRRKSGSQPSTATPSLGRGSSEGDFDDRVGEEVRGFHRQVADQVERLARKHGLRRIVLGGSEEAALQVNALLPKAVAGGVVEVLSIPMRYGAHQVLQQVQPLALEYERRVEMVLVEQVIDLAKAGGRGALGQEAVSRALERGQVELLLAPWPLEDEPAFRELAERALTGTAGIELVRGPAAERLRSEGGLGARLYYGTR